MKISIVTIFPELFTGPFSLGILGKAVIDGKIEIEFINPRRFTHDVHQSVDDRPYGGGEGMVMMGPPLKESMDLIHKTAKGQQKTLFMGPQGRVFSDKIARELCDLEQITMICGRYEGVDERFLQTEVDEELSVGDYVLSGGEFAAMIVVDAIARFVPGVLGNSLSSQNESFSRGILEGPQFTRPQEFAGLEVPEILRSGDHAKIEKWKYLVALLRTQQRRPDLLKTAEIPIGDLKEAEELLAHMSENDRKSCGLDYDS
jgi:tRNA (guanine37-N1)-methyltransferase